MWSNSRTRSGKHFGISNYELPCWIPSRGIFQNNDIICVATLDGLFEYTYGGRELFDQLDIGVYRDIRGRQADTGLRMIRFITMVQRRLASGPPSFRQRTCRESYPMKEHEEPVIPELWTIREMVRRYMPEGHTLKSVDLSIGSLEEGQEPRFSCADRIETGNSCSRTVRLGGQNE
jgi:hypothetical protein